MSSSLVAVTTNYTKKMADKGNVSEISKTQKCGSCGRALCAICKELTVRISITMKTVL